MKRILLVIILFALVGCCAADENAGPNSGDLVKKVKVYYHHTENCSGHVVTIERIKFEVDGHEMWLFETSSTRLNVIHSPECKKCNPSSTSILDIPSTKTDDYWGW